MFEYSRTNFLIPSQSSFIRVELLFSVGGSLSYRILINEMYRSVIRVVQPSLVTQPQSRPRFRLCSQSTQENSSVPSDVVEITDEIIHKFCPHQNSFDNSSSCHSSDSMKQDIVEKLIVAHLVNKFSKCSPPFSPKLIASVAIQCPGKSSGMALRQCSTLAFGRCSLFFLVPPVKSRDSSSIQATTVSSRILPNTAISHPTIPSCSYCECLK